MTADANTPLVVLSFDDRQMIIDHDHSQEDAEWEDDVAALNTLPPGEEAMFLSHKGSDKALCRTLFEDSELPEDSER